MAYKLKITEHADMLLDNIVNHLLFQLKNKQAAVHLLDEINHVYNRLEENPLQFPPCRDTYLADKGYREAVVLQMDYIVIFNIRDSIVNVVGIFHQLENYHAKI